jgi:hypothetical protein
MAPSAYLCSGGSATTGVIGIAAASYAKAAAFKIGDSVATSASTNPNTVTYTVETVNTADGTVTTNTGLGGGNGLTLFVKGRAGVTSIDDICMNDSVTTGGDSVGDTLVDVYNLTTRTAGGYAAGANADPYNSGVARDLTLPLVDSGFQTVRQNGGEPKLIVTGLDQYDNFNQLLQAQQRFVDVTDFVVGVGDDRTYPGTRAGFQLATYRGVPILPDPDTAQSINTADVVQGSDFYILDTDYLELAVMYPTQYVENRDYFAANALVIRGMFITMIELRALRPDCQYKLSDLKA